MKNSPLIFYVDDDQDDRELFEEAASVLWARVRTFECAAEMLYVIQKSEQNLPSLVFVDLNMPMISGYDVITILRAAGYTFPIIVLTTSKNGKDISKCREMGADYFIVKPSNMHSLKEAIEHTLGVDWDRHKPALDKFARF
jgi:CheY-like chemotaxis protein